MTIHRTGGALAALLASTIVGMAGAASAQGIAPVEWSAPTGGKLTLYGQINEGVLSYDDGIDTETYGLIANSNSQNRIGFKYSQAFGAWKFENVDEIGYSPYSSNNANITNEHPNSADYDFTNANIRKLDFTMANEKLGKFYAGQGSMATDGIQEIDLSGTNVIAYSSVADTAGGQIIRYSDPDLSFEDSLSGITIGKAFTNYDGPRRVRVRYDAPTFHDFTFATAFGRNLLSDDPDIRDQNIFDASLNYKHEYDAYKVEAGLGYYWAENNITSWGGSASALHKATGLNATFGFGTGSPNDGPDGTFYYAKLGLLRDYFDWGSTAVSIDYYEGNDFYVTGDATSSDSKSWALAMVQRVDRINTELWVTVRDYDYSDNAASYEGGQAIFGGARFKF